MNDTQSLDEDNSIFLMQAKRNPFMMAMVSFIPALSQLKIECLEHRAWSFRVIWNKCDGGGLTTKLNKTAICSKRGTLMYL